MGNIHINRRVNFAVCCFTVMVVLVLPTACTDNPVDGLLSDEEHPVEFHSNSDDSSLAEEFKQSDSVLLNSSSINNTILPLATWTAAQNIWSITLPSNVNNEIYGPNLSISETGSHYLTLQQNSLLNPSGIGFVQQAGLSFSNQADESEESNWQLDLPYPIDITLKISDLQIEINPVTGGAYAIWTQDGSLYFNRRGFAELWQQEVLIWQYETGSPVLRMLDLLVDINGDAWVVWINGTEVNVSHYDPSSGVALRPPQTTIVDNSLVFTNPVLSNTGAISISWVSKPKDPFQPNLLQLVRYIPATGWTAIDISPPLNTANSMSVHVGLVVLVDESLIAMAQDAFGRIYAIKFDPLTTWSNWENVDYNIGSSDVIAHSAKLASNSSGVAMIVWSEESFGASNENTTSIFSNIFTETGNANGVHWPLPELIGTTNNRINPNAVDNVNFKTFPLMKILSDGRAIATWLDRTELTSALYTSYYTPTTGWELIPDQVVNYERNTDGAIQSADLQLSPTGNVYISWQQLIQSEFAKQYHFWLTDTLL